MKSILSWFSYDKLTYALWSLVAYVTVTLPSQAFAQQLQMDLGGGGAGGSGGGPIADVLCKVVGWFNGPIGGGIATLAIIVVGVGALMGKVSWGMAIIVGLGVGVIFGASTIVEMLGGTSC